MNLGPAEANDLAVVNTQEKTFGIKPRLLHSVLKICHCPIALVGMVSEDEVVQVKPRFRVNLRIEGDELVGVFDMRDGFLQRTVELKDVAHR